MLNGVYLPLNSRMLLSNLSVQDVLESAEDGEVV
jgi:hypothetical protein